METLKISEEQFLGKQELNRLLKFIFSRGFKKTNLAMQQWKNDSFKGGIIIYDSNSVDSFKVGQSSTFGKITVKGGFGIDNNFDLFGQRDLGGALETRNNPLINYSSTQTTTIPNDSYTYYLGVRRIATQLEEGTISIDTQGNVVGTGTKFSEVIRGLPLHSTKIKLSSGNNVQEYEVLSVSSDTSCVLQGLSFIAESGIQYSVVGSFTNGVIIPDVNKYIYNYTDFEVVMYTSLSGFQAGEYVVATISNNGSTIAIEDLRFKYSIFNDDKWTNGGHTAISSNKISVLRPSNYYEINTSGGQLDNIEKLPNGKMFIVKTNSIVLLNSYLSGGNFDFGAVTGTLSIPSGTILSFLTLSTGVIKLVSRSDFQNIIQSSIANSSIEDLADVDFPVSPAEDDILTFISGIWTNQNFFEKLQNHHNIFEKTQSFNLSPDFIIPTDTLIVDKGNIYDINNISTGNVVVGIEKPRVAGEGGTVIWITNTVNAVTDKYITVNSTTHTTTATNKKIFHPILGADINMKVHQGDVFGLMEMPDYWYLFSYPQYLHRRLDRAADYTIGAWTDIGLPSGPFIAPFGPDITVSATNYPNPSARLDGMGNVWLRGDFRINVGPTMYSGDSHSVLAFTLPVGYRPSTKISKICHGYFLDSGQEVSLVYNLNILTNGDVVVKLSQEGYYKIQTSGLQFIFPFNFGDGGTGGTTTETIQPWFFELNHINFSTR